MHIKELVKYLDKFKYENKSIIMNEILSVNEYITRQYIEDYLNITQEIAREIISKMLKSELITKNSFCSQNEYAVVKEKLLNLKEIDNGS